MKLQNLPNKFDLFELYHENSKLSPASGVEVGRRIHKFFADWQLQKKLDNSFKEYADASPISVNLANLSQNPLYQILIERESVTPVTAHRQFKGNPISFSALSEILAIGYSEVRRRRIQIGDFGFDRGMRTIPSGGGLYPLDLYVWNSVVEKGSQLERNRIYHFHPRKLILESIGVKNDIIQNCFPQLGYEAHLPSTVIIITCVHKRSSIKYGERSYRFVMLEAGHLMQNMLLAATSLNVSCVPIGGFYDDLLGQVLKVNTSEEYILYCLFLGN